MQNHEKQLAMMLKLPQNSFCADCGSKSPSWVSLDYGVFVCMNCSGAHRALGPNNTRVKSTQLDTFQPEWVRLLSLGNVVCNQFWEHSLGDRKKLGPGASLEERHRYLIEKYIKRRFCPEGEIDPITLLKEGRYVGQTALQAAEQSKQAQLQKTQPRPLRQSSQQPTKKQQPKTESSWGDFLNPFAKQSGARKPESSSKASEDTSAFAKFGTHPYRSKNQPPKQQAISFDFFSNFSAPSKSDASFEHPHVESKPQSLEPPKIHQLHPPHQNHSQQQQQNYPSFHAFHTYSGGGFGHNLPNQSHFRTGIHHLQPHRDMFSTFTPTPYNTGHYPPPQAVNPFMGNPTHSVPHQNPAPTISYGHQYQYPEPTKPTSASLIDQFNEFA